MRNAQLAFVSLVTSVLVLFDTHISYHVIVNISSDILFNLGT